MNSIDIFPWNDNFNTGIPLIDEQHRKLADLINLLASHVAFNANIPALNVIFDELAEYAVYHFDTEEKIWHEYMPDDLLEIDHRKGHSSFLTEVLKLKNEGGSKPVGKVIEEILAFLTRWLAAHILESDRSMAMTVMAIRSGMSLDAAKKHASEQMRGATRVLIDIILSIYESLSTNTLHLMRELAEQKRMTMLLDDQERHFEVLLSTTPVGIFETDINGKCSYVNARWSEITGLSLDEARGDGWSEALHPEDKDKIYAEWIASAAENRPFHLEYRFLHPDGKVVWVFGQSANYKSQLNDQVSYVGTIMDITERKQIENKIIDNEERLRLAFISAKQSYFDLNLVTGEVFVSPEYPTMLGFDPNNFHSSLDEWLSNIHPKDLTHVQELFQDCLQNGGPITAEYRRLNSEGGWVWIKSIASVIDWSPEHQARRMIGIHSNITKSKQSENELRVAATVFESQEGMMVTDANSIILRVNNAFSNITGYSAEEAIGKTPKLLNSGRHNKAFYAAMWQSINNGGAWEGEIWNRRKNGEIYPEHLTITAVKDTNDIITNYVATLTDITQSKAASEEIKHLAFYDSLTKLPNRRLLLDRLDQALAASARSGERGALLFLDLDHFKTLNDTLGHDVGDVLLQQVAARLTSNIREGDTVSRLGGDEFVILLESLSKQAFEAAAQAQDIAEKIISALNQPYALDTHTHYSTSSIGATVFNGHEQMSEELLRQADIAMYQSKTEGRNTLRFFDPNMQEAITLRVEMEGELRKAIQDNQFELYYQIQVDSVGQAVGAEALIRWQHPARGMISPLNFIPLAEDTGLILPIGQWVLETACAQLKTWQQNPLTQSLILSINVSAKQFHQEAFVEQVQEILQLHDVNPERLKLELTESILVHNISDIAKKMNALSNIGVCISLDDFGTGYSSLQYLKKLPINQLKIDQSFVHDIVKDASDRAIVRTIITMANSLDLNVIAEGVETAEQRQYLLDNGCTHYQGYLFSTPVPIKEFEALLSKS